ncbi:MAG: hypothetical protein HYV40_03555 [Candidatus Levybacteria bacterium]|nr:hypothetical protein [Candidatus Levybacteria bacterium]
MTERIESPQEKVSLPIVGQISDIPLRLFAAATGGKVYEDYPGQIPQVISYGRKASIIANVSAVSGLRDLPEGTQLCRIFKKDANGNPTGFDDHFFSTSSSVAIDARGTALILTPHKTGLDFSWIEITRSHRVSGGSSLLKRFATTGEL